MSATETITVTSTPTVTPSQSINSDCNAAKRIVSLLIGATFGLAMEKSKLILPEVIIEQMKMHSFQMLKAFLTASAISMFAFAIMFHMGWAARQIRCKIAFGLNRVGFGGNILGGLVLGAGMAVAGSCPGTVFAQMGAGLPSAKYVLIGCLIGAYLYGFQEAFMKLFMMKFGHQGEKSTLDSKLKLPYWQLSAAIGVLMLLIVATVEYFVPWQSDIGPIFGLSSISSDNEGNWLSLRQLAWSPIVGGMIMGLMQVPSMLATGTMLGASSSYVTVVRAGAAWIDKKTGHKILSKFTGSTSAWLQVLFALGAILGSFISVDTSRFVYPATTISPLRSVIGGILLVLGARTAGGCTSGHGLSGLGQLSVASLVSTAAMFAGGMLTALFL